MATSYTFTGRVLQPWSKKINPLWWFLNDNETSTDFVFKYLRNPLSNFRDYVIGVVDRNYTVTGTDPVDRVVPSDYGAKGWKWSVIWVRVPLPFIAYTGKRVEWYAGWEYGGSFGIKFNLLHSKVQVL